MMFDDGCFPISFRRERLLKNTSVSYLSRNVFLTVAADSELGLASLTPR